MSEINLDLLLRNGYFPKELPPPFHTTLFADYIGAEGSLLLIKEGYRSNPCIHTLARPGSQRRKLSIPNPVNHFLLSKLISENDQQIFTLINRSTISISKPVADPSTFRAYVAEKSGSDLMFDRLRIRSGRRFVVKADISRFYHSIYTHTIPWAILGKTTAKGDRKSKSLGNLLDKLVSYAQDQQTMGIPVGPDTSYIISEIIASAFDEKIQEYGFQGFRYVDDFEFAFTTLAQAETAIPILEAILSDYELALNPLKTSVHTLPILIERSWRLKIKGYPFDEVVDSHQLIEYFDVLFEYHNSFRGESILKYGISRLRSTTIADPSVLIDLLFQCILVEPGVLKESLFLFAKFNIDVSKTIAAILFELIAIHAPMKHGSEVAWAIWAAIWYEIPFPVGIVNQLIDYDDSVIALLTLDAYEKGLIKSTTFVFWQTLMNSQSLSNGHWLLAYEAEVKGWLPSSQSKNHIDSDPFFNDLKKNKVSFYDANVDYVVSELDNKDGYNDDVETRDIFRFDVLPF